LPLSFNGQQQSQIANSKQRPSHFIFNGHEQSQIANSKQRPSHFIFNGHEQSQIANSKQRPSHFILTASNNLKSRTANNGLRISFKNSYDAQRFKISEIL